MKEIKGSVLLLGVGGISMYQLALAFLSLGYIVYGYDAKISKYTTICLEHGALITTKFDKSFLQVDFCVSTGAIKENNKYIKALNKLGIKVYDRAFILGEFAKLFKCTIAVAGTHGKSTTATLIYEILCAANKKVSCHIGADVDVPRFNLGDDYLVVEACEYNKSFLSIYPQIAVITNVEAEHMDSYKNMFNLRSAFFTVTKRAKLRFASEEKSTKFLTKLSGVEFVAKNKDKRILPKLKGEYNLKNISLAIAVAKRLGIDDDIIYSTINSFNGVPRRYQYIGGKDTKIYIDYAHHPTEVGAFIETFNKDYNNNLIVFQPHTYSRTKLLLPEFIKALSKAEELCVYKEYPARESPSAGISAYKLYLELRKNGVKCCYVASPKGVAKHIKGKNAVAFVGAGDINQIAQKFK